MHTLTFDISLTCFGSYLVILREIKYKAIGMSVYSYTGELDSCFCSYTSLKVHRYKLQLFVDRVYACNICS